ncbi:serine/threonine-protein kinase [Demequina oxidasica]|uniref:serine/threonine-protein kinase n=1 Tax=Demequina oxidasica TaxID=676199 RepID=UPI000785F8B2|nr:serine/threonine-protein kinase [Demequina oxidasica]
MASVDRRVGESIGGYQVTGVLGRGGSGAVYRVTDDAGTPAALKLVDARADAVAATRLEREVAALQSMRHEAVPRVIDAELDADETFVVFELVPGDSLFHYVQENGPLQGEQLASFAERMASALEAAHAAGVVHRDVTPSNVMMGPDGPVLIDFGLSHRQEDERLTRDGLVSGTAGYVAPEVIDGADPGPVADDWSWAATVAYAMSGTAPFGSGSKSIGRTLDGDLTIAQVPGAEAVAAALGRDIGARPGMRDVVAALRGATTVMERGGGEHALAATSVMAAAAPTGTQFIDVSGTADAADAPGSWETATSGSLTAGDGRDDPSDAAESFDVDSTGASAHFSPRRRTMLLAWGGALAAGAAVAPVVAFGTMVVLAIFARAAFRRHQALSATRSRKGVRRGDTVVHTIGLPWYLLRAAAELVPSLLLSAAAGAGTAAAGWWLVSEEHVATGTAAGQSWGHAIALAGGAVIAMVVLAWGPLTGGTREGAHRIAYAVAPTRSIATLWVVVALAAVGIAVVTTYLQADIWWWPLPPVPDSA